MPRCSIVLLPLLALACSGTAGGGDDDNGQASAATAKPAAHAAKVTGDAPVIDGRADDAAWSAADAVSWTTDYAGNTTPFETRVRFLWDAAALYILWEVHGAALDNTDRSKPVDVERDSLFKEDCVEVFLTPDAQHPSHYYEIELGPYGHWFDLDVDLPAGKDDASFSSGARVAATQDPANHTAIIEAALEADAITAMLEGGAQLPMGLYRVEGKQPRTYLAWSPPRTPRPNFHVPSAFGSLTLDDADRTSTQASHPSRIVRNQDERPLPHVR